MTSLWCHCGLVTPYGAIWLAHNQYIYLTIPYSAQSHFMRYRQMVNWARKKPYAFGNTISNISITFTIGERTVAFKIIARCSITQNPTGQWNIDTWWRHQMETFSALLAICARNSPVLMAFFYLRLNNRLSKQSWGWWFETPRATYDVIVMNVAYKSGS